MSRPFEYLDLGRQAYASTLSAMQSFSLARQAGSVDCLWIVEHDPVFTLGLNTDHVHLLDTGDIPVVQSDRGGQVTYHGPGQLVIYTMLDMTRQPGGVRLLVAALEGAIMDLLAAWNIAGTRVRGAPGVYVNGAKIASIGLRIRRGFCYHGIALNVDVDLQPFSRINPCGYQGLAVTRLADLGVAVRAGQIAPALCLSIVRRLENCGSEETT